MEKKLTASMEDYLEIIYLLVQKNKLARAKDIADHLGVKKPSVTGALRVLSSLGLIKYSPYGYIDLTDEGNSKASKIFRRHEILKQFFVKILRVDPQKAEDDACKVEHAISDSTLEKLVNFMHFIEHCPRTGFDWLNLLENYCQKGNKPANCIECTNEIQKKARDLKPKRIAKADTL